MIRVLGEVNWNSEAERVVNERKTLRQLWPQNTIWYTLEKYHVII